MSTRRTVAVICLGLLVGACTRQDSVFSMSPGFTGRSDAPVASVANCIASRWDRATRALKRRRSDGVISLRTETLFTGVSIGVRLRSIRGETLVEYFERRYADPLYVKMVRSCLAAEETAVP